MINNQNQKPGYTIRIKTKLGDNHEIKSTENYGTDKFLFILYWACGEINSFGTIIRTCD